MKIYLVMGYDCKDEREFFHYDGYTEELSIFTSKTKAKNYARKIGAGIPLHTYFVKEIETMK